MTVVADAVVGRFAVLSNFGKSPLQRRGQPDRVNGPIAGGAVGELS